MSKGPPYICITDEFTSEAVSSWCGRQIQTSEVHYSLKQALCDDGFIRCPSCLVKIRRALTTRSLRRPGILGWQEAVLPFLGILFLLLGMALGMQNPKEIDGLALGFCMISIATMFYASIRLMSKSRAATDAADERLNEHLKNSPNWELRTNA